MFGTFVDFSPEMIPVSIKKDMAVVHTYLPFGISIAMTLSWIPVILVRNTLLTKEIFVGCSKCLICQYKRCKDGFFEVAYSL